MAVLVLHVIHLVQDLSFTLNLGFFSFLWLVAFFYLGLAVKVFKNRNLSFAYLIVSCFFFITAFVEIFAMSEYFGFGEGMRNNSLFKYGIIAWGNGLHQLRSLFATDIWLFYEFIQIGKKRMAGTPKGIAGFRRPFHFRPSLGFAGQLFSLICKHPLFISLTSSSLGGFSPGVLLEKWSLKKVKTQNGYLLVLSPRCYSTFLDRLGSHRAPGGDWPPSYNIGAHGFMRVGLYLPAALAFALVSLGYLLMEGRNDIGRRMASYGWIALVAGLGHTVFPSIPYAASRISEMPWFFQLHPPTTMGRFRWPVPL